MRRMVLALVLGAFLAMLIAGGVAFADTLIGTPNEDRIEGGDGKDVLYGLGASDTLSGLNGNDVIYGDLAPDTYNKDPGAPDWDAIYLGNGGDNARGNEGADVLYAGNDTRHDVLRGGADRDVFVVDRAAYANGEDVIIDEQGGLDKQDGVPLPSDAKAADLHQTALDGGPVLYYYSQ